MGRMKKKIKISPQWLGFIVLLTVLTVFAVYAFFQRETTLKDQVSAHQGDLLLKNINKGQIDVISQPIDQVKINLIGPADELRKIHFKKAGDHMVEFSLPEDSEGISGTIEIPNSLVVVNLDLPPQNDKRPAPNPKRLSSGLFTPPLTIPSDTSSGTPPTIPSDTPSDILSDPYSATSSNSSNPSNAPSNPSNPSATPSNSPSNATPSSPLAAQPPVSPAPYCGDQVISFYLGEECDDGNQISNDGCSAGCKTETNTQALCGNGILEAGEECDDGNTIDDDLCSNQCVIDLYKKFLGQQCTLEIEQSQRNFCCQVNFENEPHPNCQGSWVFDYHSRLCTWLCPEENCSTKTSVDEKDACCANKNANQLTPPCEGKWTFANDKDLCEFQCLGYPEVTERRAPDTINQVSQYCTYTYPEKQDQNICCDAFLRHPLSIGPRPGFPDCIGKWVVKPGGNACEFECSTHENMIEILKELRLRKAQE